jgi:dGTPase
MRTRTELEVDEDRGLAPYGMRSRDSRGREHPEIEHGYRTAYQRDRDRIVHCAAFRRLEYKTQVFVNTEGDYYRTRLTHTLEVASIARTVARTLGLNQDLTEALALVHDLGHGPFGHAGERAIADCMARHGGFEHNRHGLRIVELLEHRYPTFRGLNLTYETREGMAKHGSGANVPERFGPGEGPLLEAVVADIADRLAYNHHDLDDGLTSGILAESTARSLPHVDAAFEAVDRNHPGLPFPLRVNQVFITLLNAAVTDLVQESSRRLAALTEPGVEAVRRTTEPLIAFSCEGAALHQELHECLFEAFYCHWRVARMQENAKRYVTTVFEYHADHPRTLPPHAAERIETDGAHQAVCDHVAAMTDRELSGEYRRIILP